jgi:hypothetical protein
MSLLLEDTGSPGKLGRAVQYVRNGQASGLILTPMKTPRNPCPRKDTATACVTALRGVHGEPLWDPATHVALIPNATELGAYEEWDLWPGPERDLTDAALAIEHVERCLDRQTTELGVIPIAPTVVVTGGHSESAEVAMSLAEAAAGRDKGVGLHLVGTPELFSGGRNFDDYVGALAQLAPARWFVSVMRPDTTYPVVVEAPGEVEGLCRTTYSLSFTAPVVVKHGDLAGLAAFAAGATDLASGWNLNQRILARAGYQQGGGGRGAIERILCRGLLGVLKRVEVEELTVADGALSAALVPGDAPLGPSAQWDHHINHLADVVAQIAADPNVPSRCLRLAKDYAQSAAEFQAVGILVALQFDSARWIEPFQRGLLAFLEAEGWPTS